VKKKKRSIRKPVPADVRPDLRVKLAGINMKNPVMTASGTFGYGEEFERFMDLDRLGGITVKSITLEETIGNPAPRMWETPSGMLNAIGLQNVGFKRFVRDKMPYLRKLDTAIIVNIAGRSIEEYAVLAEKFDEVEGVDALELNISCPNVKEGFFAFGSNARTTHELVTAVRRRTGLPLIVKLSPNVTDIALMAKASEEAGANVISLVNTMLGMAIDPETRRTRLANGFGGLSGPAIRPIAVRLVYQTRQVIRIPIVGMGGILTAEDALEFILAGANAVSVGTANFVDPRTAVKIVDGIEDYLIRHNMADIRDLVGKVQFPGRRPGGEE
jgi:dihydroorotate dehydrogenase (NAD+) catalytic subunit